MSYNPMFPNNQFYMQDLQNMRDKIDMQMRQLQQPMPNQNQQTPAINQTFQLSNPQQSNNDFDGKYVTNAEDVKNTLTLKNTLFVNKEMTILWLKDAAGNKVDSLDAKTNSEDLKLYFEVSVKKEGYFNGNITLNNANFKLKSDVLSDGVNKIENNTVYLNQINAGESKEIEVGIELLKNDQFDLNYLSMESSISANGIYRDSTQKDISIKADRGVTLNFVNTYSSAEEAVVLS